MSRAPQEQDPNQHSSAGYLAAWQATMQLLREGKSFSGREQNCALLNCGRGARFANVSAITGLDFPDDGRVVATVDWDHDGDLDVWLHNRTGPRLRLMENQTVNHANAGRTNNYLTVRLRGTEVNRDAIGARVEICFNDPTTPRLMRTLYAGDAYLSQSSKALHFGLGTRDQTGIRAVRVTWPGGAVEEFSHHQPGATILLVEGSGKAITIHEPRELKLTATEQAPPRKSEATRVLLFNRPPLPILQVKSLDDSSSRHLEFSKRPTLLVLWASWCSTCRQELQELSRQWHQLDVIAIAVDEAVTSRPTELPLAEIVSRWQLSMPVVVATRETLDKLELLGRVVLNQQAPLAVPTSFLIDDTGRLAAIYRGRVDTEQLASDISSLGAPRLARRDRAIPTLEGKWTTPPKRLLLRPIANIFRERGYAEDYMRYLETELDGWQADRATAATEEQRASLDRQFASDNFNIAIANEWQLDFIEAIDYYRRGLAVSPDDARAWRRLALCLKATGKPEDAIAALREGLQAAPGAIGIRIELATQLRSQNDFASAKRILQEATIAFPASVATHFHLGTLLAAQQDLAGAVQSFRAALTMDPDHFESLLNLGAILASERNTQEGIDMLHRAVSLRPGEVLPKLNLARALLASGDSAAAQRQLQDALVLDASNAQVHLGMAQIALATNRPARARDHLSAAVNIDPNDQASRLRLAWLQATSVDPDVRDAARAVAAAKQLNEVTKGEHPIILDTLAAAHASAGNFAAARAAAERAVEIFADANQKKMSQEVKQRLELYKRGQPYVQPTP